MRAPPLALAALLAASLAGGAYAAAAGGIGGTGALDVFTPSGNIDVNYKTCNGRITGGVRITQGAVRLQAREAVVSGRPVGDSCDLNHFEATNQVFYVRPEMTVKADKGVYDAASSIAVFTGAGSNGVVVVQGQNVFTTPRLTVNTLTQETKSEGGGRMVFFPETAYSAAGTGWSLSTSAAALSLIRAGAAPIDVANPGLVTTNDVLSWTAPSLKVTLTPGACSFGGRSYTHSAQVQAGASSYTGCGGRKSDGN